MSLGHSDVVSPFFILYIMGVCLALGNLVTAVIITNAETNRPTRGGWYNFVRKSRQSASPVKEPETEEEIELREETARIAKAMAEAKEEMRLNASMEAELRAAAQREIDEADEAAFDKKEDVKEEAAREEKKLPEPKKLPPPAPKEKPPPPIVLDEDGFEVKESMDLAHLCHTLAYSLDKAFAPKPPAGRKQPPQEIQDDGGGDAPPPSA